MRRLSSNKQQCTCSYQTLTHTHLAFALHQVQDDAKVELKQTGQTNDSAPAHTKHTHTHTHTHTRTLRLHFTRCKTVRRLSSNKQDKQQCTCSYQTHTHTHSHTHTHTLHLLFTRCKTIQDPDLLARPLQNHFPVDRHLTTDAGLRTPQYLSHESHGSGVSVCVCV